MSGYSIPIGVRNESNFKKDRKKELAMLYYRILVLSINWYSTESRLLLVTNVY